MSTTLLAVAGCLVSMVAMFGFSMVQLDRMHADRAENRQESPAEERSAV